MISTRKLIVFCGFLLLLAFMVSGCDSLPFLSAGDEDFLYSGVVEAVEIAVAPQVGGRVIEVYASEGDAVLSGDPLFELDDTLLSSQYEGASAAHQAAQSNLEAAQASLDLAQASLLAAQTAQELAQIQHQQVLNLARLEEQAQRISTWDKGQPDDFETPPWYFTRQDEITAAEAEVLAAEGNLEDMSTSYSELLEGPEFADLRAAEERLAQAQVAFLVAQSLLDRDIAQADREPLQDSVQALYDDAQDELESAQAALDQILVDETRAELLAARAEVTVAQERYETALDLWSSTLTGDQSLEVRAAVLGLDQAAANIVQAEAAVSQAEAVVAAAQKVVDQAQAALAVFEIQIDELTVSATDSGVILVRNIQPGEVIQPGMAGMTIGKLDALTITVYVPEDRYGQIDLGDAASVTTDSFPGENFQATVTRIADQAEYTPRNVGTEEDRSTIVFAVELSVSDPDSRLKPGMLVDVSFGQ